MQYLSRETVQNFESSLLLPSFRYQIPIHHPISNNHWSQNPKVVKNAQYYLSFVECHRYFKQFDRSPVDYNPSHIVNCLLVTHYSILIEVVHFYTQGGFCQKNFLNKFFLYSNFVVWFLTTHNIQSVFWRKCQQIMHSFFIISVQLLDYFRTLLAENFWILF